MEIAAPLLSAIVISFNTREMTLACLGSLETTLEGCPAEVLVVDNASTDGSLEAIKRQFPGVILIKNERNLGFGAANNLALRQAHGKYLLLLNSDAIPRPGAIEALVQYLERNPSVAAVGPRLLNEDGTLQPSCFRFPTPLQAWLENLWLSRLFADHPVMGDYRRWKHDTEREVDFVVGACLLVRRSVFEELGGFDERFFLYQEEADWQKRMREAGWRVVFTPAAKVVHLGGGSGKSEPDRIGRHFFESLDSYSLKHHGVAGLVATRAAMFVGCSLRAMLWALASVGPANRQLALQKMRKHAWLVRRQLLTAIPARNFA